MRTRTSAGLSKTPGYSHHELHLAKLLRDVRRSGANQRFHGVIIHGVAGDKDNSVAQLRTVREDPFVYISTAGAAGRTHVRDNSAKCAALEQTNSLSGRAGCGTGVAVALQRHADEIHDRSLVLDEQQRQGLHAAGALHCLPPAPPIRLISAFILTARRPLNVAPGRSWLLEHTISPSCSRTMP